MTKDVKEEIYILDKMITSLVELLDDKGIIQYEEWENKLKEKLEDVKGLTRFEDLEE